MTLKEEQSEKQLELGRMDAEYTVRKEHMVEGEQFDALESMLNKLSDIADLVELREMEKDLRRKG